MTKTVTKNFTEIVEKITPHLTYQKKKKKATSIFLFLKTKTLFNIYFNGVPGLKMNSNCQK